MYNEAGLKWKSFMGQVKVLMSPVKRNGEGAQKRGSGPPSFIDSHSCPHLLCSSAGRFPLYVHLLNQRKTVMVEKPCAEGSGAGNSILGPFSVGSCFPAAKQESFLAESSQPPPSISLELPSLPVQSQALTTFLLPSSVKTPS